MIETLSFCLKLVRCTVPSAGSRVTRLHFPLCPTGVTRYCCCMKLPHPVHQSRCVTHWLMWTKVRPPENAAVVEVPLVANINKQLVSFFLFLTDPPTLSESANLQALALLYLHRCILCMTVLLRGNKKRSSSSKSSPCFPPLIVALLGCECVPGVSLR